jgi:hypothetical protein
MNRGNPHAPAIRNVGATPGSPIRIASTHPPSLWRSPSGCRGRPLCLSIRITWVIPTRCRNPDVPRQSRRGSDPECKGRPLCLPIRIAHALRRDAVSCKPHPKIQPAKLHPQIGYRRFTLASGGQLRRISISPVRALVSPKQEDGSKIKPSAACAGVPRKRARIKNKTKRRVCRLGFLCPPLTEQRCMPRRHHRCRLLCPPRAGVDTRSAWPGVDCKGRHRGLPLRATESNPHALWKAIPTGCGFLQIPPHDVRLTVPAAGPVEDFRLQGSAPCRAHKKKDPGIRPGVLKRAEAS